LVLIDRNDLDGGAIEQEIKLPLGDLRRMPHLAAQR
jgi:hypothetical protein